MTCIVRGLSYVADKFNALCCPEIEVESYRVPKNSSFSSNAAEQGSKMASDIKISSIAQTALAHPNEVPEQERMIE